MANSWFRLYAEFANDPKVQMMNEAMQRRYVMLMCLRCSNVTVTLHETEIAFALRITDQELADTKKLFLAKGFIDEQWNLLNWEKRQFASDSSAERVARHRAKQKEQSNGDVTLQKRQSNALDTDTDTEDIDKHALACPYHQLVELYHKYMPDNPKCKVLNATRRSIIKARWLEASRLDCQPFGYSTGTDGLEAWSKFFQVCAQSDFLTGKSTPKPGQAVFFADIDFLFSASGFAKCLENKYHRGH